MQKNIQTFWVANISNKNVSLADLNVTIKAYSSVNLMDLKHYSYTLDQLKVSAESGSLHKKSNKIVIRKVPPEYAKQNIPIAYETSMPTRIRSVITIKQENYEELNVTDEEFAEISAENADVE